MRHRPFQVRQRLPRSRRRRRCSSRSFPEAAHFRRSYDMVGRYGGEEFLVLLNKCGPVSAVPRAENLRESIFSRPIQRSYSQLTVSISLGLALTTDFPRCDVEELLHHADMALYAAKAADRTWVRIAQPESVDRKSALPDVVPDKESPLLTP
ncbi:MAG: GGDEF domain-containing protein [Candidatus Acidiferrum sp.]